MSTRKKRFAVIVFPGSNCDVDMLHALQDELGQHAEYVWHSESNPNALDNFDGIFLPGGFSYGDYLRCGSMASLANIVPALRKANDEGKPIMGVCNGFQILTELGFLPGALLRNESMQFVCRTSPLNVENNSTMFTGLYEAGEVVNFPIAHGEGNYYCDEATLAELKANRQIVFTYQDNPNGSLGDIAGITNKAGNVLGMMPHPERAVDSLLGGADGLRVFQSILKAIK